VTLLALISCNRPADILKRTISFDQEEFDTDQIGESLIDSCLYLIEIDNNYLGLKYVEEVIGSLQNKRYYNTAYYIYTEMDLDNIEPSRLEVLYTLLGQVTINLNEFDEAEYFINHALRNHPEFPHYVGHNSLNLYNFLYIIQIVKGDCENSKLYADSLARCSEIYKDSLFYIGGKRRLLQAEEQLRLVCADN
jgi:hypothetical protein